MTPAMFILLLIWIAACTAKPEPKTMLGQIDTREPVDYDTVIGNYGKRK